MEFLKASIRFILSLVQKPLHVVYNRLMQKPLNPVKNDFIKSNADFWKSSLGGVPPKDDSSYILVLGDCHPVHQICNASLASIVGHARDSKLLFLCGSSNPEMLTILKSYPHISFLFTDIWRYPLRLLIGFADAVRAYQSIKTPNDLLRNFVVDGIHFGDVIYDTVLAGGYATIDKIDLRTLKALVWFYYTRALVKFVIRGYDIRAAIVTHYITIEGATFTRYLLKDEIEIFNRLGSKEVVIKKFRTLDDLGYPKKPEKPYVDLMLKKGKGTLLELAEAYLESKFKPETQDPDTNIAGSRKIETNRLNFCKKHGLDAKKPIAFVMLHAFNDYPHSHFKRPMIFQDFYDWFIQTLRIARTVEDVNWVFKDHPASEFYGTKDFNLSDIFSCEASEHIRFMSFKEDFDSKSLRYLADVVITCTGTAGLENAAFGIPCILGGESQYSGFGFTTEPKSIGEYASCLRRIGELKPLDDLQMHAAKFVYYFYFFIMQYTDFHFCPSLTFSQIDTWDDAAQALFWEMIAKNYRDVQKVNRMQDQIQDFLQFVRDPSVTQYIDRKKFTAFPVA